MSDFSVTILGSSSAIPTTLRNPSAQWIDIHNHALLIDCAEATQHQIRKYKKSIQKIAAIYISHLHGDHYLGLPGLISTMNLLGREHELKIFSPPGLEEIIALHLHYSRTILRFPLSFIKIETSSLCKITDENSWEVYAFPLQHRVPTYGYLIREKTKPRKVNKEACDQYNVSVAYMNLLKEGHDIVLENGKLLPNSLLTIDPPPPRSYAYCSDTAYYEPIVSYLQGIDLLYHEATFDESMAIRAAETFHSTARQAATIAQKAKVKKLILGHFSNRYMDVSGILQEARKVFPATECAEDGKVFVP